MSHSLGFVGKHRRAILVLTLTCINITLYQNVLLRQSLQSNLQHFKYVPQSSANKSSNAAGSHQENRFPNVTVNVNADPSKYLIDTAGCRLPLTSLWPKFYADDWNWISNPSPDCRAEIKITTLADDDLLELQRPPSRHWCNISEILKDPESDNNYLIKSRGRLLAAVTDVRNYEMMMTQCGSVVNFEASIPTHATVEKKLKYWSEKPAETAKPPNVLILGFDSTSRMHVLRGMPKTLKVMRELGFLDFKGFHTIEPSTLPNFMGMLMGKTEAQARESCVPDWDTPFDNCSLIWKLYGAANYVTVFNEDGSGTFNWGGQSGFKEKPTDYYLHPLLKALNVIRGEQQKSLNEEQCVSSESVPSFMLRYVRRFLQKFHSSLTPSFVMDYHTNPFHDSQFALPTIDEDVASLLNFLRTLPGYLDNTLIVLMGDHGDRYNFFSYDSIESYIERALPPLFLRIPERILKASPEFAQNALLNTERLITTFDLHHTFLHILSLSGLLIPKDFHLSSSLEFIPSLPDRSSLFLPIPESRDCASVNIVPGFCVCNATESAMSVKDPFFAHRLLDFAILKLNEMVAATKYSDLCYTWALVEKSLISANVLEETESYQIVLLKFMAWPAESEFGVNIKVWKGPTTTPDGGNSSGLELHGKFSRINKYGTQSSCVGFKTPEDKEMKEFCYCVNDDAENN